MDEDVTIVKREEADQDEQTESDLFYT